MYELMLALFLAVGATIGIQAANAPEVDIQLNRYTMKVQLRVSKITLEDAGKFERTLKEWFTESSVVEVILEPDTTNH